jgi:hypothetical protein
MLGGRRIAATGQQAADALTAIPGADLTRLRDAFARGLAERPDDRFDTALEFAGALKAAFPTVEIQSPVEPTTAALPPPLAARPSTADSRQSTLDFHVPTAEIRAAEAARYEDVEAAPAIVPVPLEPRVATRESRLSTFDLSTDPDLEPSISLPPSGLLASYGEPPSALERSRSAMWPLVLALIVGIALGFGAGYSVGKSDRGATPAVQEPAAGPVPAASVPPPQPTPAGREFTEGAVAEPPKPTAGPAEGLKPDAAGGSKTDAAGQARTTATDDVGRLVVKSTPAGARVFVDGRDQGRTPTTVRDLSRGVHRVRLVREGYATEERRIVITPARPSESMTVALARLRAAEAPARRAAEPPARPAAPTLPRGGSFFGSLSVESRPAGAKVFIDGKLSGTTPLVLPQVGAGEHAVRLEHDGYRRWTSSVRVASGERNRVTASLEK